MWLVYYAVAALREIGKQVGKKDWNFSVDPCTSNDSSWNTTKSDLRPLYNNSLNCNCSVGVCHVDKLYVPFISLYIICNWSCEQIKFLFNQKQKKVLDFQSRWFHLSRVESEVAGSIFDFAILCSSEIYGGKRILHSFS
jgi:hypothetical protein